MAIRRNTKLAKVTSALNTHVGRWTQLCHPSTAALTPTVMQKHRTTNIWRHNTHNVHVRTNGHMVRGIKSRWV